MGAFPHRAALLIAAAALLAGACSSGGSAQDAVLPAEQIFDSEITVIADPSGTSAVLTVTTSVDLVCAVVYGTTAGLGEGIATDADMAGGAHADHHAVMTGLRPGTEYFYRVQGSGADGNLYQSQLMTFRTPEADAASAAPGENVAVGASVVDVSSEFSEAFAAPNAIDGDPSTEWSSAGDGDDAFITIDFGVRVEAAGVGFRSRAMTDGTAVVNSFTVTIDGAETLGPFPAGRGLTVIDIEFTGQELRFDAVDTTGGNTGAVEIEVYVR